LFADGGTNSAIAEANRIKAAHTDVVIFAVGFGNGVGTSTLNSMASEPSSTHVLTLTTNPNPNLNSMASKPASTHVSMHNRE
jgi:DNA-binding NarL/FixJ family response regulator